MQIMYPADILIPKDADLEKWSVIACDQFTSEPGYWDEVEKTVGEAPSALKLILPEAWLDTAKAVNADQRIAQEMASYKENGIFETIKDGYIYLERTQPDGRVRRGLIAAVDLEQYDFAQGANAPVRATEGTVEERLPPRIKIRSEAPLELPHAMILMDDRDDRVLGPLECADTDKELVYDFELMQGGGHVRGWKIDGELKASLQAALDSLADAALQKEKYGLEDGAPPFVFAIGDGNHSLAAAKRWWEAVKSKLSAENADLHPARFALVEINNIHEEALDFEPIHRVLIDTDTGAFAQLLSAHRNEWEDSALSLGERVKNAENFCKTYIAEHGGRIDYIHGDDEARELGSRDNCAAVLLPPVEKQGLFLSVLMDGALPKKSFSMGHARDKRYYLEARYIN